MFQPLFSVTWKRLKVLLLWYDLFQISVQVFKPLSVQDIMNFLKTYNDLDSRIKWLQSGNQKSGSRGPYCEHFFGHEFKFLSG